MRFRLSQHDPNPDLQTNDVKQLLERVHEHLARISEARQDFERQCDDLQTQLDHLDGIAQRLALLGLVAEGARILEHQAALDQQRLLLSQQHEKILAIETRLRSAELQLLQPIEHGPEASLEPQDWQPVSLAQIRVRDEGVDHLRFEPTK